MSKLIAEPKTLKTKPSIRFVPNRRQYEAGIDFVRGDGIRDKITLRGYLAQTMEDERKILRIMEVDKHCGITTWENREMPPEQKAAEGETRMLKAENDAMRSEMDAMREEMRQLKAAKA